MDIHTRLKYSMNNSVESEAWTVIQRRIDGSVDFKRSLTEYKEEFGFMNSEFWLGNQRVSFLTNQMTYELRTDMINVAGLSFVVHHDQFRTSDDWGEFRLASFGAYSGNASSVTTYCSANMEYGNCFCQATCSGGCQKNCNDAEETCICPNGFFLDQDSNCVSEQECSCYREEFGLIQANSGSQTGGHRIEGSSYFFYQHSEYPRDCQEILNQCSASNSFTSGVYLIKPDGYPQPFEVFCDNSIESEGWTVIQRRVDGSVDFSRTWTEYKDGFGFLSSEFWLGNGKVSYLTNQRKYELQIEMTNAAGSSFFVRYDQFRISDDWGNFKLGRFGEYSGNASSATTFCPTNMEYGNCSCQATCSGGCQQNCADGEETCLCPNGFFLDQDSNCVSEQECSCFEEGFGVIPDGDTQVNSDCSRRCSCNSNQLSCVNIQCSSDATCQEIGGAHQCQCNEGFEGDGLICTIMSDCFDLYHAGNTANGVYTITVAGSDFQVYCDMTTDGGGWTVFQRRRDGSQNFYRNWATYKSGFGPLTGEHWLGNDKIHTITNSKDYQLRVDLVVSGGSSYYQLYDNFRINNENDKYRTSLGSSRGTAGNSLYNAAEFSTYDRDNDSTTKYNCAEQHRSGWWHLYAYYGCFTTYCNRCYHFRAGECCTTCSGTNLNGRYTGANGQNIFWEGLPGRSYDCNIPQTEMKIRPM